MPLADGLKGFLIGGRTNIAGTAQNPDVDQEELRILLAGLLMPGRLPNLLTAADNPNAFQVRQDSGSNMQVRVGSTSPKRDAIYMLGTIAGQGGYIVRIDDPNGYVVVTVPATDATFPAKYSVFLYVNDAAYGGDAARATFGLACLRGTPAASPAEPAPLSTWSAYYRIATFQLAANATAVTNAILTAGTSYIGGNFASINNLAVATDGATLDHGGVFGTLRVIPGGIGSAQIGDGTIVGTDLDSHLPRGLVVPTAGGNPLFKTDAHTGIGSGVTDVNGMSMTFPTVFGRRYRVSAYVQLVTGSTAAYPTIYLRDGSNNNLDELWPFGATGPFTSTYALIHMEAWMTGTGSNMTAKVSVLFGAGTNNQAGLLFGTGRPAYVSVMDAGVGA